MAALVVLGIGCVGASAYLVQLAVGFFDQQWTATLDDSAMLLDSVEEVHRDLIDAHIQAYRARARALALELESLDVVRPSIDRLLAEQPDLLALDVLRPGEPAVRGRKKGLPDDPGSETFRVDEPLESGGQVVVEFAIDPAIDARYQSLGQRRRTLAVQRTVSGEMQRAVVRVLGIASVSVLLIALGVGFVVARATTRKVGALSDAMQQVASGDLKARSQQLGNDEVGQLATAFNRMLDDLQRAQQKVVYLQRIGAWQDMARRIAHEIKNPLTPIQLAAQQLREKDPGIDPKFSALLQTSVEIIEDEVEALRRMVVSFSRFAKTPEARPEPVSVQRILHEFQRAYGHLTELERDELRVPPIDSSIEIYGDRQLVKQVLVNLVENGALSARDAGRDPVIVEITALADEEWVELSVEDNGPGIARDQLESIFEPYTSSREQGTGLGLAIVKKIVLDHGGEVWAETSERLGGARIRLKLPRHPHDSPRTARRTP